METALPFPTESLEYGLSSQTVLIKLYDELNYVIFIKLNYLVKKHENPCSC